ncbi:hypothetical protein DQ04_12991020, partial [Trypanosoma grayi]|uniref:hypothetical protein n=1 Tax=Trypanosoma grayi TaxID=71804 RepID=UPI0004F40246
MEVAFVVAELPGSDTTALCSVRGVCVCVCVLLLGFLNCLCDGIAPPQGFPKRIPFILQPRPSASSVCQKVAQIRARPGAQPGHLGGGPRFAYAVLFGLKMAPRVRVRTGLCGWRREKQPEKRPQGGPAGL